MVSSTYEAVSDSARETEAVISPEMISAGTSALWPIELPAWENPEEVVQRVYRAMAKAGREASAEQ
jgi:hypothetical protein